MSQNSMRYNWSAEEVDAKLKQIMSDIHEACVKYGESDDAQINYVKGANIAGFVKIADAMIAQGAVWSKIFYTIKPVRDNFNWLFY